MEQQVKNREKDDQDAEDEGGRDGFVSRNRSTCNGLAR